MTRAQRSIIVTCSICLAFGSVTTWAAEPIGQAVELACVNSGSSETGAERVSAALNQHDRVSPGEAHRIGGLCAGATGDCWGIEPNNTPGCEDPACCSLVCDEDGFCCEVMWDENCSDLAWSRCGDPQDRGACCAPCTGTCDVRSEEECTALGGTYLVGLDCSMISCSALAQSDRCSTACPVSTGGRIQGTTLGMTAHAPDLACGPEVTAPGVWFRVFGTGRTMTATTCGDEITDFDTQLTVYCSDCEETICMGGVDDSNDDDCSEHDGGRESRMSWCSVPGGEYFLHVHGSGSASGMFGLEITEGGPCNTGEAACFTGQTLIEAKPAMDESLWRSEHNEIVLTFDGPVATLPVGAITIRQMLSGGDFGPDLANHFDFVVDGAQLRIVETSSALTHGRWYAVAHGDGWRTTAPFAIHYVYLIGDANNDGRVLPSDLSYIGVNVPCLDCGDNPRSDINGDGHVLPDDLSTANARIPHFGSAKPDGHE